MLKFIWIILAVLGIGAAAVEVRSRQGAVRAQMHRTESQRQTVRRSLGYQQLRLAAMLAQETERVASEQTVPPAPPPQRRR